MFYSLLTSLSNRFDGTIPEVTAEPGAAAALISGAFSERAVATERLFVFASFVVSLCSPFIHVTAAVKAQLYRKVCWSEVNYNRFSRSSGQRKEADG